MCDLGVSDSKSGHSYPFFSAYIVVWYFLVEMVCHVVYFGSICRSLNSVPFFSLVVEASRSWCGIAMLVSFVRSVVASLAKEFSFPSIPWDSQSTFFRILNLDDWRWRKSTYAFFDWEFVDFRPPRSVSWTAVTIPTVASSVVGIAVEIACTVKWSVSMDATGEIVVAITSSSNDIVTRG